MHPREFFERAAPAPEDLDSEFIIGPVGTSPNSITHQMAITFNSTPNGESVTVVSADTDPKNHDITKASISTVDGGEFQAGDFQIGERTEQNEIHLRFVPTALGEAEINAAEPDRANMAGYYVGTLASRTAGTYATELFTAKFEGDEELYLTAGEYTQAFE